MQPKIILTILIVLVFLACHVAKGLLDNQGKIDCLEEIAEKPAQRRIVSMAPSVTETLFALGLGDRVVGVSRFCKYPPEAAEIAKIGGVLDPNIEAIVALKPDLAIMLHGNKAICPALERLGIKTLMVNHKTISGILESIPAIGQACGREPAAKRMADDLRDRIERVRQKAGKHGRPGVLVSVIRNVGTGRLEDVYVAGQDKYFDEMIATSGGRNVFGDQPVRYPVVSNESIIEANPEIIIEILPNLGSLDKKTAIDDWRQLSNVDAVAAGNIFCLDADYASVPGPRFILLLEKMAELIRQVKSGGHREEDRG